VLFQVGSGPRHDIGVSRVGAVPRAALGAKVQIGLRPVQRCKRERYFQVPGLGPRVSGSGDQLQVLVRGKIQVLNLYPNLRTCTWYLTAETRDLKVYAPSQSSGLRFPFELCSSVSGRVERPRSTAADQGWSAHPQGNHSPDTRYSILDTLRRSCPLVLRPSIFPSCPISSLPPARSAC
jgi:hypothetical protein